MHEVVIVGEQVAGRAALVRQRLRDINTDAKITEFDLADLLFEAQEHGYPQQWGFESLPDYAERELGLKARRAQYLARITRVCRAVGLSRVQYEPAGRSKLREITTLKPEGSFFNTVTRANEPLDEHIVRLILDSDSLTYKQIKAEVARLKGQVGKDARVIRSYSTDQQSWDGIIAPALEKARRYLGSQGRDEEGTAREYSEGVCYEMICAAFNASLDYEPEPPKQEEQQSTVNLPMEEF
jgi:hypothetical protein